MFIRQRPELGAGYRNEEDRHGKHDTANGVEGIRRFAKAFPDGIPGLLSPQSIKNVLEFDVRVPIKIKEDIPPEKVLSFRLMREVQELSLSAADGARSAIKHVLFLAPTLLVFD